jgi:diacylglycerol kinase
MDAQKEENKCRITSLRSNLKVIEYSIRAIKNIVAEETAIKVKKIIEMSLLMIYLPYF